jgi:hypothetical protein
MRTLRLWLLLPLTLALPGQPVTPARPAAPGRPTAARPAQPSFFARFADGSQIRLSLLTDKLGVQTEYGRLVVPVKDVSRIEFGQRVSADARRKIRAAIERLAGDAFTDREAAGKELLEYGPAAYRLLLDAGRSDDLEVQKRVKELLAKLEGKHPSDLLRRRLYDLIHTPHFTIAGIVEGDIIDVHAAYFGKAKLKPHDLWELRSRGGDREQILTVEAAKYASQARAWKETAVEVHKGRELKIAAAGTIDMYPLAGWVGQYMATPAGAQWQGGVVPGGMSPGALIGRIGTDGPEFVVGTKFEGTADRDGKVYLRIVPSPWNNDSSGDYRVTISQ